MDQSDVNKLLDWFSREGVQYPWADSRDPYAIWVSEVMLQQTTIAAVLPRYQRWMRRFPGTAELARASESEVLREWEGLGYYNRARNLASAAREVQARYGGTIPDDRDVLRSLPGVGDYISAAVAGFAFGRRTAAIDANGRRIAMRLTGRPEWEKALESGFSRTIEALMPDESPGILNAAIMQLGQIVCLPRKPRCGSCPLSARCRSLSEGLQNRIPAPKERTITVKSSYLILLVQGNRILMKQKERGAGTGLWVFPDSRCGIDLQSRSVRHLTDFPEYVHTYTRYREALLPRVFVLDDNSSAASFESETGCRWLDINGIEGFPMPAVYRKITHKLLNFLNLN